MDPHPPPTDPAALARAFDEVVERHTVEGWLRRVVVEPTTNFTGFPQDFDGAWRRQDPRRASVVYQSRIVWTAATLARYRPQTAPGAATFGRWAEAGLDALLRRFATGTPGGVAFWEDRPDETHLYAVAFALYAAAALARFTGTARDRERALSIFAWLDAGAWDSSSASYAEGLDRDARPLTGHPERSADLLGTPWGAHSSNALLHAVEALTELVEATNEPRPTDRLAALVERTEAVVARDGGRLHATYDVAWRPLDRTRSFGHDVEAYHLVRSARRTLGWDDDTPTEALARRALDEGLHRSGGLRSAPRSRRWWRRSAPQVWWAQAEAAFTLAVLARDDPAGRRRHLAALGRLRHWIETRFLDRDHGGWIESVTDRGRPVTTAKAHAWKACYHETRGLLGAAQALRTLAGVASPHPPPHHGG